MLSIRKNDEKSFPTGLTLIELLIVTALLGVVSLAIYSTFNNGIKIWQRVNQEAGQEDLDIFFDKFAVDLRNTFKFSEFNFLGEEGKVEFVTLVDSPRMQRNTVGKVAYFFDPQSKTINRVVYDFSQIYDASGGTSTQLVKNVQALAFQYYFYDSGTKEYFWLNQWPKEGLPLSVKIELSLISPGEGSGFVKTVSIPVSN